MPTYRLHYGLQKPFEFELESEQLLWCQLGPETVSNLETTLEQALSEPLDYPQLSQAVVPGDRIAIAVDPSTPSWPAIVKQLGTQLVQAGIDPEAIHILLNEVREATELAVWSKEIPYPLIEFDEVLTSQQTYLASTAEGERVYLPAELTEADYLLTVSRFGFDDRLGYRGTHSTVYPAFASPEDRQRLQGAGFQELTPETSRGVRQMIDEVGWLLGIQYSVQVLPSQSGEVAHVLSGASDSVYRRAQELLHEEWRFSFEKRAETVLISLPSTDTNTDWEAFARACHTAAKLSQTEGRVLILTESQSVPAALVERLVRCGQQEEVLRMLNRQKTPEAQALSALAQLATQSRVYLLSGWEQNVVESLFCIPLANEQEMRQALLGGESYAILNGATFAYVEG